MYPSYRRVRPHPFAARARLVFAHRGGAALAPENTLAAFENGMALGSDGLECDVHLSRDGLPVVIHDPTLDRTTDAHGEVSARTASELAAVDAGWAFGPESGFPFRGRTGGVPTLEQIVRAFPQARMIIEMKSAAPALARGVIDVIRQADAVERVCVGAFDRRGLTIVRAEAPEIATSASVQEVRWTLFRSWCRWPLPGRRPYQAFQVPERAGSLRVISPAFVAQAHNDSARVDVWLVNQRDDMHRLFTWGVDGVITDYPDRAVSVREEWARDIVE